MSFSGDTGHAYVLQSMVCWEWDRCWLFVSGNRLFMYSGEVRFMLFSGRDGRSGRSLTLMMLMDDGNLFSGVCCLE